MQPAPLPPLSLYIHIPWCVVKCPYCDFHSLPQRGPLPEAAYVAAVLADLDAAQATIQDRTIGSVFFGGGTPSLFSGAAVASLLAGVAGRVRLAADAEITLEANPGTVEAARFQAFREAGVNRLSLGVQSLHDAALKALGRIHDARAGWAAMEAAAAAGFASFNVDIMYGLPGQTPDAARTDMEGVLAVHPPHLSLYELTIEAHTAFAHNPPALPEEDMRLAIEEQVTQIAAGAGYERYEVSAYARPGQQARHNLNYWRFGDYLGLGAGAHSKLTDAAGTVVREVRMQDPQRYLTATDRVATRRVLARTDLIFEFLLNNLRLTRGFDEGLLRARTGQGLTDLQALWREPVRRGLLAWDADGVRATALGRRFLDSLLADILDNLEGRKDRPARAR